MDIIYNYEHVWISYIITPIYGYYIKLHPYMDSIYNYAHVWILYITTPRYGYYI